MRKKREDGIHETYEKKEVCDICVNCPTPSCNSGSCQRLLEEKQKLKLAGISTKVPEYEN